MVKRDPQKKKNRTEGVVSKDLLTYNVGLIVPFYLTLDTFFFGLLGTVNIPLDPAK